MVRVPHIDAAPGSRSLERLSWIDVATISAIERSRKEWELLRDPVGRPIAADRSDIEIHTVSKVRYGGVRQDTGHDAQSHISDIVVRSPAVRPAGLVRRRVAACVMGKRPQSLLACRRSGGNIQ